MDNMIKHCIQEIMEKFGIEVAEDESTLSELRVECEQAKRLLSSSPEETLVIKKITNDRAYYKTTISRGHLKL